MDIIFLIWLFWHGSKVRKLEEKVEILENYVKDLRHDFWMRKFK